MTIKQHRTLASNDAYASRGGWLSGRSADVITYHREYGKVGQLTISPEMVEDDRQEKAKATTQADIKQSAKKRKAINAKG